MNEGEMKYKYELKQVYNGIPGEEAYLYTTQHAHSVPLRT